MPMNRSMRIYTGRWRSEHCLTEILKTAETERNCLNFPTFLRVRGAGHVLFPDNTILTIIEKWWLRDEYVNLFSPNPTTAGSLNEIWDKCKVPWIRTSAKML